MNTIHPVLKTVTDRITERSSAPHTYRQLAKRKAVDPRAGVSPAPTWPHSFLVSPAAHQPCWHGGLAPSGGHHHPASREVECV